jgi:RHS repeat-associated protein
MECRYYLVEKNNLIRKGDYEGNILKVIKSTDEDGKELYEFKDNIGRTLMTRQTDGSNNYETYYVYDDLGYLRFVIPPKATDLLTTGVARYNPDENVTIKNLCYTYRYDGRGNCIYKRLPGAEPIYYIYDKAGSLTFSQDGELRAKGRWAFSIPDKYNRVCLTGTCKHNYNYQNSSIKNVIMRATPFYGSSSGQSGGIHDATPELVNTDEELGPSINTGYYVTGGVLWTSRKYLTINYYDNYNFYVKDNINNTVPVTEDANLSYNDDISYNDYEPNAKTLLTGTVTAVLDDYDTPSAYLYSVMYYDGKKRSVQTKSTNAMGGYEKEYINYNFIGQPTKRKHIHTAENKETITEEYRYTYDHASRPIITTHKLNDGSEIVLSDNSYDEIGRLWSTNMNSLAYRGGMERPQRLELRTDYSYNVRNWLTGIYHFHVNEEIAYNNGANPCWNGNISSTNYSSSNHNSIGLNYQYDGLNRLISATNLNNVGDLYSSSYSYDKNGNMLSLIRNDNHLSENLNYSYYGNHLSDVIDVTLENAKQRIDEVILESVRPSLNDRLLNLQELANAAQNVVSSSKVISGLDINEEEEYDNDIIQGDNPLDDPDNYSNNDPIENEIESPAYAYDKNGNLIRDNTTATGYSYNVLGLPLSISTAEQNGRINYKYDARGNKLSSYYSWNNGGSIKKKESGDLITVTVPDKISNSHKQTEYVGNKIYKDGSLDMILLSNGYIKGNLYYFYIKDHLGNNIAVIDAEGNLIQQTFYHPYGKSISDLSTAPTSQPYKYGGNEAEGMFKLNFLDFHARQYKEPHFTTMDPFCEIIPSVSPYAYCLGNPIMFTDKAGRFPMGIHGTMTYNAFRGTGIPLGIISQVARGSSVIADIFGMGNDEIHLDNMGGINDISAAYYAAISGFNSNMAQGNYLIAGVYLHTIADFYSHSNYVSLYSAFVGESNGKYSYNVDKIPIFTDALQNPEFLKFVDKQGGLKTGTFSLLDPWSEEEGSHYMMNLDKNKSEAGGKPYNENNPNGATMHEVARKLAERDLGLTVGGRLKEKGRSGGGSGLRGPIKDKAPVGKRGTTEVTTPSSPCKETSLYPCP